LLLLGEGTSWRLIPGCGVAWAVAGCPVKDLHVIGVVLAEGEL
jgi:hypothetical protein